MQNKSCPEHLIKTGLAPFRWAGMLGLALIVAGCGGGANPVRDVFSAAGAGPPKVEAPDFVKQTRPGSVDYMPIGVSAPERRLKARDAEQTRQFEKELEALRQRNAVQGEVAKSLGATPAPSVPSAAR
jgi:hypothetical protein